jgi:predicted naringenin-chalcone synthase
MTARVQALGTAMPENVLKQPEIVEDLFARQPGWDPAWAEVFANAGVERRASVVDPSYLARPGSTADRMRIFAPAARRLGAEAARRALERAGPDAAAEVGDLLAVSCTGYSGPGLDVHLVDDLGLGERTQRLAVGHMGCYAALPALRTAAALAAASGRRALVACVELCTLHIQPLRTREDAVYLALFGDGAAAALVGPGGAGPAIAGSATVTMPRSAERMGWQIEDHGFQMWLSPRVPALVERGVGPLVDDLLAPHGLVAADVAHWAVHPGGPEIVDRVQRRLGLSDAQTARSREVLADGGNRSSATILFILEQLLGSGEVEPGQWIVALAFGTGLTLEALLLRA